MMLKEARVQTQGNVQRRRHGASAELMVLKEARVQDTRADKLKSSYGV